MTSRRSSSTSSVGQTPRPSRIIFGQTLRLGPKAQPDRVDEHYRRYMMLRKRYRSMISR